MFSQMCVILSIGGWGEGCDVTSCLAAWSFGPSKGDLCTWFHVPYRAFLSMGASVQSGRGLNLGI